MVVMENPMRMLPFTLFTILTLNFSASSTITQVSKEQIPCTLCFSCDNPCQPLPSPPPPPSPPAIPECPPPPPLPSPPPPALPECPPTPAPINECPACLTPAPPFPPAIQPTQSYGPPAGNSFYGKPGYGNNPVPYFPFDNNNPPPSFSFRSFHLKMQPIVLSIFLSLTFLCFF